MRKDYNSPLPASDANDRLVSWITELIEAQIARDASDKHYIHHQNQVSSEWVVEHNLNKFPAITVVDSAGTRWIGTEIQKDSNTVILQFAFPFSGVAYCN